MKYFILLLIITLSTLYSADITLDEQITQLQNSDAKERFKLMNALKLRISTMNANDRSQAITQLKTQMFKNNKSANPSNMQHQQQMLASDQMHQMNKHNQSKGMSQGSKQPGAGNKPGNSKK
ncbi:MAG: hypothetical protein U9R50_08305 [Campylobacterota bacterium]|nr:hypothetical protein [Campylobacterota bacterium]